MGKDILYFIIYFYTVFAASFSYYIDTTEWLDGTFQQFICLQTNDKFILLIYITGLM
jgi:amino acid permease